MSTEKPTSFPGGHRPIPKGIAYPADYGLASATGQLLRLYGVHGTINRLIEMAERIEAGEKPLDWVMRRKRVDPDADPDLPRGG